MADTIERVLDAIAGWAAAAASEAGVPEPIAEAVARDIEMWSSPLR